MKKADADKLIEGLDEDDLLALAVYISDKANGNYDDCSGERWSYSVDDNDDIVPQ